MRFRLTSERRDGGVMGGWTQRALLEDGRELVVSMSRGLAVRIPYKPRGQNRGHIWHGHVVEQGGARFRWSGQVPGSLGVRGILKRSGLTLTDDELRERVTELRAIAADGGRWAQGLLEDLRRARPEAYREVCKSLLS